MRLKHALALIALTLMMSGCMNQETQDERPIDSGIEPEKITLSQVSEHSSQESCWTIVDGKVYDVTGFASKHPGGPDKIHALCGKDGSEDLRNKHGMGKDDILQQYFVGDLI
jgi:cytochrome b involved in lipid metabolism